MLDSSSTIPSAEHESSSRIEPRRVELDLFWARLGPFANLFKNMIIKYLIFENERYLLYNKEINK